MWPLDSLTMNTATEHAQQLSPPGNRPAARTRPAHPAAGPRAPSIASSSFTCTHAHTLSRRHAITALPPSLQMRTDDGRQWIHGASTHISHRYPCRELRILKLKLASYISFPDFRLLCKYKLAIANPPS